MQMLMNVWLTMEIVFMCAITELVVLNALVAMAMNLRVSLKILLQT